MTDIETKGAPAPASEEALIEEAAKAICDARLWPGAWVKANEVEMGAFRHDARAALAILSPAIRADEREKCAGEWRDIASAPTDNTLFLAATADGRIMIWRGSILANARLKSTPNHLQFPATHWQPLPAPPAIRSQP